LPVLEVSLDRAAFHEAGCYRIAAGRRVAFQVPKTLPALRSEVNVPSTVSPRTCPTNVVETLQSQSGSQ
ncbi:MAG TPA: hypothetical protein VGK86_02430, partial [Thermoanaerobaculia bacterium]